MSIFDWSWLYSDQFRTLGVIVTLISVALAALSYGVAWLTWQFGTLGLYLGLASGFVFLGPLLAVGLYSLSRQREAGQAPSLARSFRAARRGSTPRSLSSACPGATCRSGRCGSRPSSATR